MSYLIVDVLGFTGVAGEKKSTLGDSSLGEDYSIGQHGAIADAKKAAKADQMRTLSNTQGADDGVKSGSGAYSRPTNKPIANR